MRKFQYKHLREIASIIARGSGKHTKVLTPKVANKSQLGYARLFRLIVQSPAANEELLVSEGFSYGIDDPRYVALRARLRDRLLNSLFLLDLRSLGYSDHTRRSYINNKRVFQAKTLVTLGARGLAMRIARLALRDAIELEATPNIVEFAIMLRTDASLQGRERSFSRYDVILDRALITLREEAKAYGCYQRLVLAYARSASYQPQLAEKARAAAHDVRAAFEECHTFALQFFYFRLQAMAHQSSGEYARTIQICRQAALALDNNPLFDTRVRRGEFALKELVCALHLKDYTSGEIAAKRCREVFEAGGMNWFVFMEWYFLLAMHTEHFDDARRIYETATQQSRYASLTEHAREKWLLFSYYLDYAEGRLSKTMPRRIANDKRHRRVFRDMPLLDQDKRGYKVALIILQILYLLEQRDYPKIVDLLKSIEHHRNRYFKRDRSSQAAVFLYMLQLLSIHTYHRTKIETAAKRFLKRLGKDGTGSATLEGFQIIPFEILWEKILRSLDDDAAADKYSESKSSLSKIVKQ